MRGGLAVLMLVGCAGVQTTEHPEPPRPVRKGYVGRIVLSAPDLPTRVLEYKDAWVRRIAILDVKAHLHFDRDRAVIDVDGAAPGSLARIAEALVDRGDWKRAYGGGRVAAILPPSRTCACSARIIVDGSREAMCRDWGARAANLASPPSEVDYQRGAERLTLSARIHWRSVVPSPNPGFFPNGWREDFSPLWLADKCEYPSPLGEPDWLEVITPEGATADEITRIALIIGGGQLPMTATVVSVEPAQ